jgi:methylmalonyl-CoA/ethylmalonyl-CoA epimerase
MKPKGVNRVVIAVKDFDKGMKLYGQLLGAKFLDTSEEAKPYGIKCALSFDAGIELCAPLPGRPSNVQAHLDRHGEGVMGVVFCIDDVDAARDGAEKMKMPSIAMIADYDQAHIDKHLEGRFKRYKEYMLNSNAACGYLVVIGQIEPK